MRLVFEKVTGKDLNWFWNHWYYGSGHPKLTINYNYDVPGKAMVIVEQTQTTGKVFKLPVAIDVYTGSNKQRYNIWLENKIDTLWFPYSTKPDLINVDADKILLSEKKDNKSEANYVFQWMNAKKFSDRMEAISFFAKNSMPEIAKGLNDKYAGVRTSTIQKIATTPYKADANVLSTIENIARKDNDKKASAAAIQYLVKNGDKKHLPIYQVAVNDSSYSVAGAGLKGLVAMDSANAYTLARKNAPDARGSLGTEINNILINAGRAEDFEFISNGYRNSPASFQKVSATSKFAEYLSRLNNLQNIKQGIDEIMEFRNLIPVSFRGQVDPGFKAALDKISKAKGKEIEDYISEVFK